MIPLIGGSFALGSERFIGARDWGRRAGDKRQGTRGRGQGASRTQTIATAHAARKSIEDRDQRQSLHFEKSHPLLMSLRASHPLSPVPCPLSLCLDHIQQSSEQLLHFLVLL